MKLNICKLNQEIERSKFTKSEIASNCKIDRKTIENVLAGRDPKLSTITSLATFLNLSISYLFDEDVSSVHTEGNYSPATTTGNVSMNFGDQILSERVRHLEELLAEKNERISELKERIEELKFLKKE
ncbi:MAG: hypothetical protein HDS35_07525 [Bacteroides sp.]|nr:hypothetical protein [Bacteroides sp.]